ncbi:MAG: type II toxin-antitoxin system PemK/MazF family toxin [Pyrinomonadaceae bacterium]
MIRGELYRVEKPSKREPKGFRVFVIVSRQEFVERTYPSVICAPVYSNCNGLSSEVEVGVDEGLRHDSCIRCDELVSLQKSVLTNFIGSLSPQKIQELNQALKVALEID